MSMMNSFEPTLEPTLVPTLEPTIQETTPMPTSVYQTMEYWYIGAAFDAFTAVVLTTQFSIHFFKVIRHHKDATVPFTKTGVFTMLSISLFTFYGVQKALTDWEFMIKYCMSTLAGHLSYPYAKLFMHFTFLLRLHTIYKDTEYKYKPIYLKCFAIFSSILVVSASSLHASKFTLSRHLYPNIPGAMSCTAQATINPFVLGGLALSDFVMSVSFIIMFTIPLLKLAKTLSHGDAKKNKRELTRLAARTMILTSTACLTTMVSFGMLLTPYGKFTTSMDMIINVLSMMLISQTMYGDRCYKICYALPIFVSKVCFRICFQKKNRSVKELERIDIGVYSSSKTTAKDGPERSIQSVPTISVTSAIEPSQPTQTCDVTPTFATTGMHLSTPTPTPTIAATECSAV